MSRLADDIALLQRAADTAGLVLYPACGGNKTFPEAHGVTVPPETLRLLADEVERRRATPAEYALIDYPAVWLLTAAHMLALHTLDRNDEKAAVYRKLGVALRAVVEVDLVNARKSLGEIV